MKHIGTDTGSWSVGLGLVALGVALAGWSCSDALRIDPPPPAATTPTSNGGSGQGGGIGGNVQGGGGGAPTQCASNSDCAIPTPVCDTVKHICVECLVINDCAHEPGTMCSEGSCVCEQAGESWCEGVGCVDLDGSPDNCGTCGFECYGGCAGGQCADAWVPVSEQNAPAPRQLHVAVWSGTEMIVWGGAVGTGGSDNTNTGGMYDPATQTWTEMSVVNAPSPRRYAQAVWDDQNNQMIVWGGTHGSEYLATGGAFDPATNTWTQLPTEGAPPNRAYHSAVWTGAAMIVWGGYNGASELNGGGIYDPATETWNTMTTSPPARRQHTAVWSGTLMIIYGGRAGSVYLPEDAQAGGWKYVPGASWEALDWSAQPSKRARHTAVWLTGVTPERMLVWGGYEGTAYLQSGALLDPDLPAPWKGTPADPAPDARADHTMVWLGGATTPVAVVWGGQNATGYLDTGDRFDPAAEAWLGPIPTALEARIGHTAVSTGTSMIVWGGRNIGNQRLGNGAVYTP